MTDTQRMDWIQRTGHGPCAGDPEEDGKIYFTVCCFDQKWASEDVREVLDKAMAEEGVS